MPWELWREQVQLIEAGDSALKLNDPVGATRAFDALRATHREQDYPAALIEAAIGRADAARQCDDVDAAISEYVDGVRAAEAHRYLFAANRARIAVGYLMMHSGSSAAASDVFKESIAIGQTKGWRLDVANALTGLGEAHQRLREPMPAMRALLDAAVEYDALGSREGIANVTVQLGEVCRREQWTEDALGWYRQAVAASSGGDMVIAHVNALDGLAEIELGAGYVRAASDHYGQAHDAAGDGYPRGRAHALFGMAQSAFQRPDVVGARGLFDRALHAYQELDMPISAATAHTGLARCAEHADDREEAVRQRLAAVSCIERMRAAQLANLHQGEYFRRFGGYHAAALRAAISAPDLAAFVAVFESVAGRRLAGLLEAVTVATDDAQLLSELVRQADLRASLDRADGETRERRRTRALGGLASRGALPALAQSAFDDVVARLYAPFRPDDALPLLERLRLDDAPLLALTLLHDKRETQLAWLWLPTQGAAHLGLHVLPAATCLLIDDLHAHGLRATASASDLDELSDLLPDELTALLPEDGRIHIVPADRLWGVPWAAVPLSTGQRLGQRLALAVAPSFTMLAHLRRCTPPHPTPARTAIWRSPDVCAHQLRAYEGGKRPIVEPLQSADQAKAAILNAEYDRVVIVAHGRPRDGLVHLLDLGGDVSVTPADLLTARTPDTLALIACWGAHTPRDEPGDPMTLATLVLARGTHDVLATTSELRDDAICARFVDMVLHRAKTMPFAEALHDATRQWLPARGHGDGPLSRWAPLVALAG